MHSSRVLPLLSTLHRDCTSFLYRPPRDVVGVISMYVCAEPDREPRTRLMRFLYWLQRGIASLSPWAIAAALASLLFGVRCVVFDHWAHMFLLLMRVNIHTFVVFYDVLVTAFLIVFELVLSPVVSIVQLFCSK